MKMFHILTEIPRITPCCPASAGSGWEPRIRTSMSVVCHSVLSMIPDVTPISKSAPGVCGLYGLSATPTTDTKIYHLMKQDIYDT